MISARSSSLDAAGVLDLTEPPHPPESSSLQWAFDALRRRRAVLLLSALVIPAVAAAFSLAATKQYSASASLLFRDPALDQKLFGSSYLAPSRDPVREAATNARLVSLEVVSDRTARRLGRGLTGEDITEAVAVSPEGQSDLVSVEGTQPDPRFAAVLANTFANEYIAIRREADRAKVREAQVLVQRQLQALPPGDRGGRDVQSLRDRAQQLQILASLQTGNAELAQAAVPPPDPSSPRTLRNVGLALLLGLALGVGIALLFERLDRRLRAPKEVEDIFERPVLAIVPETSHLSDEEQAGPGALSFQEAEAFRMLRANLRYFNVDRQIKSVLVTSASPGDGKSTVAWHLAAAAAAAGDKVLLIEADLRDPSISFQHALSSSQGLSTVLSGQADPDDLLHEVPVASPREGVETPTMHVLTAGPLPPNPTDLMESEVMRSIVRDAEADLVVVDTPPTSVVSDAIPLLREVSGVIVVVRLEKNTRESTTHLRDQLHNLGARTLGIVVNGMSRQSASYGYGYEYGYGGRNGAGATTKDAITSKVRG